MDTTVTSNTPSGLWKRQSSLAVDDGSCAADSSASVNDIMEIETGGGDSAPLLPSPSFGSNSDFTITSLTSPENLKMLGHIALSFLFMMAGASIVPLFAAAEDEAWRSQNIPYQKTAAGDIILDFELNHPLVNPATIPTNMLIGTAVGLPLLFLLCVNFFHYTEEWKRAKPGRTQMHELRASLCALFVSVGLSESVTCTLKLYVSRHRPNFYALCGFDAAQLKCMNPSLEKVHEATLSFPSGHSSLSFCGMTFMMYFLLGRLSLMTSSTSITVVPGKVIKLLPYKSLLRVLCCLFPWSYAFFVATSRLVDKWHHPSDVIAGSLLGIAAATIGYHAFYPSTLSASSSTCKAGMPLSLQSSSNNASAA